MTTSLLRSPDAGQGTGSTLLKSVTLMLALCGPLFVNAQATADSTEWVVRDFPRESAYFGLETGVDLSADAQVRFGYSAARQFAGCAGWGAAGHAAGISFRPESNACGAYAHVWVTAFIVNVGLRAGYETDLRSRWATFQPQVGLGVGLFRMTYNYCIPVRIEGTVDLPRHSLGIAYTFPMSELH